MHRMRSGLEEAVLGSKGNLLMNTEKVYNLKMFTLYLAIFQKSGHYH